MPRFTITVPGEINEWLTVAAGDDGPYDSKSEAARDYLALAHRVDQLDEDFENILDRAERVDELKRKAERLENEKQTLIHNHEEHTELQHTVNPVEPGKRDQNKHQIIKWVPNGFQNDIKDVHVGYEHAPCERTDE